MNGLLERAARAQAMSRRLMDPVRWALILVVWAWASVRLYEIAWYWAALWAVPGFVIVMNLVGLLTLPLYYVAYRLSGGPADDQAVRTISGGDPPERS